MGFLRSGYRKSIHHQKTKTKKHIKFFYKILHELDGVAEKIYEKYPAEEYNEDDIAEIASEFTDLPIEKLERNILMSKLQHAIDNE